MEAKAINPGKRPGKTKNIAIALNGSMLDEHPTGVGVYSINLINNLSTLYLKDQFNVLTVFTPTNTMLDRSLHIVRLPKVFQSSKYGKLAALSRFLWNTFYYHIQARRFDLLISPTTHGSFFLNNQILTIHDLLSLRYKNINGHQRFYFKYLLPFMVSKSKLVVAVSETTKQDIIHFLKCPPDKIKVIYNGYDQTCYHLCNETENRIKLKYGIRNYLLAIGPTYPHKNFELMFEAYALLPDDVKKEYPLVVAGGKRNYLSSLKKIASTLTIDANVHFLGYVPMDLMPSLYREAFLLIFPSLYEGFGFPLLEAMACGCPVIASNTSSMPEVGGDAVMYFDPHDKEALAISVEQLISNSHVREAFILKGLEQAKKFSWEKTAQTWKLIIDNHFKHQNINYVGN
jgi:glycosyltransferase involved in cell wall biosynthesis